MSSNISGGSTNAGSMFYQTTTVVLMNGNESRDMPRGESDLFNFRLADVAQRGNSVNRHKLEKYRDGEQRQMDVFRAVDPIDVELSHLVSEILCNLNRNFRNLRGVEKTQLGELRSEMISLSDFLCELTDFVTDNVGKLFPWEVGHFGLGLKGVLEVLREATRKYYHSMSFKNTWPFTKEMHDKLIEQVHVNRQG